MCSFMVHEYIFRESHSIQRILPQHLIRFGMEKSMIRAITLIHGDNQRQGRQDRKAKTNGIESRGSGEPH